VRCLEDRGYPCWALEQADLLGAALAAEATPAPPAHPGRSRAALPAVLHYASRRLTKPISLTSVRSGTTRPELRAASAWSRAPCHAGNLDPRMPSTGTLLPAVAIRPSLFSLVRAWI